MEDVLLYKKVLNAMSTHIAILDENGNILETNDAWREFGKTNGMQSEFTCLGLNYLNVCDSAGIQGDKDSREVAQGIRDIIHGETDEFFMHYPCHSPDEKRWFAIRVVAYREDKSFRVIVSHENITPIIEIQEALEIKEKELQHQAEKLEETNIALRVLLDQRNEDKKLMEATVFANVDRLVLPYIVKLGGTKLNEHQKTLIEIVDSNLKEIISPFLQRLSSLELRLTPQEIEVAHLIRNGNSSKEIAEIMFLSVAGVDFHRKNLRKKLGITNTKQNLRSFLMSLR